MDKKLIGLVNDFRAIFVESPLGVRILDHLKDRFHCRTSTATRGLHGELLLKPDRDTMLINEGERAAILYIVGMAESDINKLMTAFDEEVRAREKAELEIDKLGV